MVTIVMVMMNRVIMTAMGTSISNIMVSGRLEIWLAMRLL